ncbi:MAG: VIT1/CCC1 transporter family protein [Nanoarchaeota archaeon]|nr:VIT1/CCC1 transporter family protein [Nanoarchaeota archaeon]
MKRGHHMRYFSSEGKYLKSWVYGGLDGIITTFAIVAGVVGANLSSAIILILGFANLLGDGISMAVGDYISTKSEGEYYKREKKIEEEEALKNPKNELENIQAVLEKKGFNKKDAKKISLLISKNKGYQAETILHDEFGIVKGSVHPGRNAGVTFISFLAFGMIPLLLFVVGAFLNSTIPNAFLWASILSGIAMFSLGVIKSKVTNKNWIRSGGETLLVGGVAATAAYFAGEILSKIV